MLGFQKTISRFTSIMNPRTSKVPIVKIFICLSICLSLYMYSFIPFKGTKTAANLHKFLPNLYTKYSGGKLRHVR